MWYVITTLALPLNRAFGHGYAAYVRAGLKTMVLVKSQEMNRNANDSI